MEDRQRVICNDNRLKDDEEGLCNVVRKNLVLTKRNSGIHKVLVKIKIY